ncbi:MAG: response regulator transcription factor [Eubacteriales bacterium]|nr:response regulator transcription factor [Eubacteriales bacterium]
MIWCVEDDASIRDIEIYALKSAGYQAAGYEDGTSFWEAVQKEKPELVVLDVMLPGVDGITLLRRMREDPALKEIPVILATARGAEIDKIQGLDLGADYYLAKPFGVMELVSCVRAVLRRCAPKKEEKVLKLGGLTLDQEKHTVTADGREIVLTYKEFELLHLFLANPGIAFTRDQLFSKVWGETYFGESRTIDTHILTLRQKLGPYGDCIKTVRNVGYRLEGKTHES